LTGTRNDWFTVMLLGLAGGLLGLLIPVGTGILFGRIIPAGDHGQLLWLALVLAASAVVMTLFDFVQGVASVRLETRMNSSVEAGVWDRLLNLPTSFFRQYSTGDLAMRAMGVARIRQLLTDAAMSSVLTFIFSFVSFGLLFYLDFRLALLATLLFVIVASITSWAAVVQLRYERENYRVRGKVSSIVLQLLTGISRLRVAGAENRALAYWAESFSVQTNLSVRAQSVANHASVFMAVVPLLSAAFIFGAVWLLESEMLTLATFLAFNAAFFQIIGASVTVSSTAASLLEIVPLYERAKPILMTEPEFRGDQRDPGDLQGEIEISHVTFRYHADGPQILSDVSLHINKGEFVALVGPSGAGKSTILRLLLGFETPTSGSIYFDGEDLSGLDQQAVRRQVGVVLQNSELTPGTLLRNIIGSSLLTLEDAWEAARLSGLDADIAQMPMGMYTVVTEGESTFSGGQRQRLLIARAIVNKPKILLFDEATSALDNVTQERVARSLEALKTTRVVVAHRLSTIVRADRIVVIERGKVVQTGNYEDLMDQGGLFARLARRQLA
jgi:ATP-binding cassette subfamily C protein